MNDKQVIDWLLDGDPAIRWQVLRDLRDTPPNVVETERRRVAAEGWGAELLALQAADGRWTTARGPKGYRGLYTPKWTSTTYTLLLLRRLGLEPRQPDALRGCQALAAGAQWFDDGGIAPWASPKTDTCVCGMVLGLFEWFDLDDARKRDGLLRYLLRSQKTDGGWNCRPSPVSSVHTTLSVLEALRLRHVNFPDEELQQVMSRGHEYLLVRGLFRSLRTGKVIQPAFQRFPFPPRWKYDVLRALDHLRDAVEVADPRAREAIDLVVSKRRKDGRWPQYAHHSGERHLQLETAGSPGRWNTLRALRVLKWWAQRPGLA